MDNKVGEGRVTPHPRFLLRHDRNPKHPLKFQ